MRGMTCSRRLPDAVGIVDAAQVHDLVRDDLRAVRGEFEPQGDHVGVGAVALDQRGFPILPSALTFSLGCLRPRDVLPFA